MFDFILHNVSGSPLTYLLIVGVCAGDAILPLFPSETIVITGAVLAAHGRLNIAFVIAASAAGALVGDNVAYGLGDSGLRRVTDRLLSSDKNRARLAWAHAQLHEHGAWIIIIARFIPGGRTATTYVSGTLAMQWRRRFLPADLTAAMIWSLFASGLGYFGGATFERNLWLPVLVATGASIVIAGVGELVRRKLLDRRAARTDAPPRNVES